MLLRRYGILLAMLALALAALPGRAEDKKVEKKAEDKKVEKKAEDKKVEKKTVSLAHLKLSGSLEEGAPSSDPLLGSLKEHFKSKLDRIHKARNAANIQALYLQLDG